MSDAYLSEVELSVLGRVDVVDLDQSRRGRADVLRSLVAQNATFRVETSHN